MTRAKRASLTFSQRVKALFNRQLSAREMQKAQANGSLTHKTPLVRKPTFTGHKDIRLGTIPNGFIKKVTKQIFPGMNAGWEKQVTYFFNRDGKLTRKEVDGEWNHSIIKYDPPGRLVGERMGKIPKKAAK